MQRLPLLILIVMAGGCHRFGPSSSRGLPDGRLTTDDWSDYASPPGQADATFPLHFDSLYLKVERNPPFRSRWYRFFPDGQILGKSRPIHDLAADPPTAADGDAFCPAILGRYRVVGDRLWIEMIGVQEDGPTYSRRSGVIHSDGSFTLAVPPRAGSWDDRPTYEVYRPHVVGPMTRPADW